MMGKTHIAVGIAAAYALTMPKTMPEFVIATVGGSIGGVMADVDVKIDTSNKFAAKASLDALYGEILAIAIAVDALIGDYFTGGDILQGIMGHPPRSHSLLALALFSVSVFLIEPHIGIAFAIGYASHLIIDLFNKSPIRILYPLKKGICFKLCYADRLGNELLLVGGVFIIVAYVFLHSLL